MARTALTREERRGALLACAQKLFYSRGYEVTSVNDIVVEAGVAKGTFYYYFDSKQAILRDMVDELIGHTMCLMRAVIDDPTLDAPTKWVQALQVIGNWKTENREELITLTRTLQSDDNALLRHELRDRSQALLAPELAKVIQQGVEQGKFNTDFGPEAAEIALAIILAGSDTLVDLLLCSQKYADAAALARRKFAAMQSATERVLGAEPGSLPIIDEQTLSTWFGKPAVEQLEGSL